MGPPELDDFWADLLQPPLVEHLGFGEGLARPHLGKHRVLFIMGEGGTLGWSVSGMGFKSSEFENLLQFVDVVVLVPFFLVDVILRIVAEYPFGKINQVGSIVGAIGNFLS